MPEDRESEVKRVPARNPDARPEPQRDPSLTGGERSETPAEKDQRLKEKAQPKEPPIIQKDVT